MNKYNITKFKFFDCFFLMYCFFPFTFKYARICQVALLYGICLIYISLHLPFVINQIHRSNSFCKASILCKGVLFVLAIIIPIIHNTFDMTYLSLFWGSCIRGILLIIAAAIYFRKKQLSKKDTFCLVVKSVSLYVLFSLVLLIPTFRMLWKNIIYLTTMEVRLVANKGYYTRFGLQGFSGYGHTILCSICVYLFWILKKENYTISWNYLVLLILGNAFYGRSGLIVSLFITCYFAFTFQKYRIYKYMGIILIFGCLFLIFLNIYILSFNGNYSSPLYWMLEPFYNFLQGNSLTASTDHMFNDMYVFDFDLTQGVFGHGRYTNPDGGYYKYTDIGFLRVMYYGGLVYLFLYYLSDLLMFLSVLLTKKSFSYIAIIGVLLMCILYEIKGESVYLFFKVFFFSSICNPEKTILKYEKASICNKSI